MMSKFNTVPRAVNDLKNDIRYYVELIGYYVSGVLFGFMQWFGLIFASAYLLGTIARLFFGVDSEEKGIEFSEKRPVVCTLLAFGCVGTMVASTLYFFKNSRQEIEARSFDRSRARLRKVA
jgi:NADH:ubiquinone oxidoreductase subunit 4 (subunit M)